MGEFELFERKIEPMDARLEHCFSEIGGIHQCSYRSTAAYRVAGTIMGFSTAYFRHVVIKSMQLGGLDGYLSWRAGFGAGRLRAFPLPRNSVGYVYEAAVDGFPNVVKIGFSGNPDRRMKKLKSITGLVHRVESVSVGFRVSEHGEHFRQRHRRISREYFLRSEAGDTAVPEFLLTGLDSVMARFRVYSIEA